MTKVPPIVKIFCLSVICLYMAVVVVVLLRLLVRVHGPPDE
jgi:hypothetical protein